MPSTLYQSVKKSVVQFADLRKKNEKLQDKLIFRWKLITLGLSIVFIILVGGFSQILKAINTLPTLINDKSYILPLVQKLGDKSVPTVKEINNIVAGISRTLGGNTDTYNFNQAVSLYSYPGDNLDIATIVSKINGFGNLVFIVSSAEVPTPLNNFGFFGYAVYSQSSAIANVYDSDSSQYSTFFNINAQDVYQYSAACPIYRRTAASLVLFQSMAIKSDNSVEIGFQSNNFGCLSGTDLASANAKIQQYTNVDLSLGAKTITLGSLQILSLSLV